MRIFAALTMALTLALTGANAAEAEDSRALVQLPAPMQEHMLANMRDHLATLDEILGRLAEGKFDAAAKLAEERLGMSSLERHGASHMAPFMPKPMQDYGTSMHHAASRLAITLQNAAVSPSLDTMAEVNRGLHEITTACTACHASYRIR
jgi:cytochrome c556